MAEIYIANNIKRWLNERYGFNFTLLQFGTYAAKRKAEMAQADPAEYLGLTTSGVIREKEISSILERFAASRTPSVTSTAAAATTQTVAEMAQSVAPAETMSLSSLIKSIFVVVPSLLFNILCNFTITFLGLLYRVMILLGCFCTIYFLFQGVAYLPAFAQVQRRVWIEDIDQEYGVVDAIGAFSRSLVRLIGWIIAAPFIAVGTLYRFTRESAGWRGLCNLWRQGREVLGEWLFGWWLRLRYNWFFDTTILHYYLITYWFGRNALRIFWAGIAGALLWRLWSTGPGKADGGVIRFGSWAEMAAYYGVPQDLFPHEHGGAFNAKPWLNARDTPIAAVDDVEVTWLDSVVQTEVEFGDEAEDVVAMADDSAEIVQGMLEREQVASILLGSAESMAKKAVRDGKVAYCRKCRQRHCCEAVEREPESLVLIPEHGE